MKSRYVGFMLLLLFLMEGTLLYWLLPARWQQELSFAPHFTLVAIMIYAMLRNRHIGLAFALVFGLMHDVVYASPMMGAHSFGMAIAVYLAGLTADRFKLNIAMTFFMISFSLIGYDVIVFSLYRLFRLTFMPYGTMLLQYLTPTLLFNLLFAVLVYVPLRKLLELKTDKREEED